MTGPAINLLQNARASAQVSLNKLNSEIETVRIRQTNDATTYKRLVQEHRDHTTEIAAYDRVLRELLKGHGFIGRFS